MTVLAGREIDNKQTNGKATALLAGLGGVALLAYLFLFRPGAAGFYPQCGFYLLTGLHCPGCGTLRCIHHLVHGELGAAVRCNLLAVAFIPAFLASWTCDRVLGRPLFTMQFFGSPRFLIWLPALLLGYMLLRNLPWVPFNLLAPLP